MPKSTDKTKGTQKRKSSKKASCNDVNNTESDGSESKPIAKKKKITKRSNIVEGISMSKDLAEMVRQKRGTRGKSNNTNNEPRLCGNGKPMPSLAELEAMYRDSDDENTTDPAPAIRNTVERSETPVKPIIVNEEALNSPTGLKQIATQVIDLITKKIENVENVPPPPVIPPKKRRKPDQPYIVGCKDRPQVPWAPKTKFAVGDEEYGVDENENEEDDLPKKRKKRGKKINLSKSIFNAKTDEIAERLLEAEKTDELMRSSTDSNDTVTYAFPGSSPNRNAFSPLPSTSKDQETFLKNDKLFNESLKNESLSDENHNDIEVIEVPYETITIDESVNDTNAINEIKYNTEDDSCVIVDETPSLSKTIASTQESPVRDDFYSSIDLTQFDSEVYVIEDDDIESVIAENKAILEKYNKKNRMDLVTAVDASINDVEIIGNTSDVSVPIGTPSNIPTTEQCTSQVNSLPTEPTTPIESTSNPTNEIEAIVTDFFNQPQEISNAQTINDTSVVDLTNCQDTILNRISSFMSSIESLFRGRITPRWNNRENDIVIVDDLTSSYTPSRRVTRDCSNETHNVNNANLIPTSTNPVSPSPTITSEDPSRPIRSLGECPICMDSLGNKAVASTLCGHVFCMGCIQTAFKSNGKKCPTCRKLLKGAGFHQLFL